MSKLTFDVEDRIATAYHEGGHVVSALALGVIFDYVELDTGGGITGRVILGEHYESPKTPIERKRCERMILMSACGPSAEAKAAGSYNHAGAFFDHDDMEESICALVGYPVQQQTWLMRLENLAYAMFTKEDGGITRAWWKVMEIAEELLKKGKLTESECMDIAFGGVLPLETVPPRYRVFPWMKLE